jgi:hypothetical protein
VVAIYERSCMAGGERTTRRSTVVRHKCAPRAPRMIAPSRAFSQWRHRTSCSHNRVHAPLRRPERGLYACRERS